MARGRQAKAAIAPALLISFPALFALLAGCSAPQRQSAADCPEVAAVRTLPFRGERGVDAAYDRLRFDDGCEPVLIDALDDVREITDPRQAPPAPWFVVGDTALIILTARHRISPEALIAHDAAARWKNMGMYAYFDQVSTPAGRRWAIARLRELIRKQRPTLRSKGEADGA